MWFFSPPAISPPAAGTNFSRCAFALRGYERRSTLVKWYFAAEDALPLPFPTIYAGSDFYQPWEADQIEYGESVFHRQRKFYSGAPPAGAAGQTYCGTEEDFQVPKPWDPDLPSEPVGTSGLPICCNAFLAGAIVLTSPEFPFQNLIIGRVSAPQAEAVGYVNINSNFFGNLMAPAATAAGTFLVGDAFFGALTAITATAAGTFLVGDAFFGALTAGTATAAGTFLVGDAFFGALTAGTATAAGTFLVGDAFFGALTAGTATAAGTFLVGDAFFGALTAGTATAAGFIVVNDAFFGAVTAGTATAAGQIQVKVIFHGAVMAGSATAAGVVSVSGGGPDLICATCPISHSLSIVAHTVGVETGTITIPYDSKINGWDGQIVNLYLTFSCSGSQLQLQTFYLGNSAFLLPTAASCSAKTATYFWSAESTTITISW